ncbi:hypothetical protein ACA910_019626 [Epithemia clementina (nom. ined.)]
MKVARMERCPSLVCGKTKQHLLRHGSGIGGINCVGVILVHTDSRLKRRSLDGQATQRLGTIVSPPPLLLRLLLVILIIICSTDAFSVVLPILTTTTSTLSKNFKRRGGCQEATLDNNNNNNNNNNKPDDDWAATNKKDSKQSKRRSSSAISEANKKGKSAKVDKDKIMKLEIPLILDDKRIRATSTTFASPNRTAATRHPQQEQEEPLWVNGDNDSSSKKNKKIIREELRRKDYEARRALWEKRYGSVEALRRTFGKAKSFWGDLDPESTRQLYHTLLPRALLGLYESGLMRPDELAPLAYKARKAAKEYARERCTLPGRVAAQAFDAYRSFLRDGTFSTKGLSWEQLWDKYEAEIVAEECVLEIKTGRAFCRVDELTLADRIYLRILERSCATNQAFDKLLLKNYNKNTYNNSKRAYKDDENDDMDDDDIDDEEDEDDGVDHLLLISTKLENDVREILLNNRNEGANKDHQRALEKEAKKRKKMERKEAKAARAKQEQVARLEEKRAEKLKKERYKVLRKALRKASARRQQEHERQPRHEDDNDHDHEQQSQQVKKTKQSLGSVKVERQQSNNNKDEGEVNENERRKHAYPVLRLLAKTLRLLRNNT